MPDGSYVSVDGTPCRDAGAHVMVYDIERQRPVCMFCDREDGP